MKAVRSIARLSFFFYILQVKDLCHFFQTLHHGEDEESG